MPVKAVYFELVEGCKPQALEALAVGGIGARADIVFFQKETEAFGIEFYGFVSDGFCYVLGKIISLVTRFSAPVSCADMPFAAPASKNIMANVCFMV